MDPISFSSGVLIGAAVMAIAVWFAFRPHSVAGPSGLTVVEMRDTKGVNARRWTETVHYDSWGAPYVKGGSFRSCGAALNKDGTTSDHFLRGTQWQRISGPPVEFGVRPQSAFGERSGPNDLPKSEESK